MGTMTLSNGASGTAFLFPGQGSQRKGMGNALFGRYPEQVALADRVLGYSIGELCLQDPERKLALTEYAQPAIFTVNALSALALQEEGAQPDYVAGHSLGEYNALVTSQMIDFETGLWLVKQRGEIMGRADGGGMSAVIGLTLDDILKIFARLGIVDLDVANHNSRTQIVLSGSKSALEHFRLDVAERPGVRVVPLQVSAAFHSRYMKDASNAFANALSKVEFRDPVCPLITNVNATELRAVEVRLMLQRQIDCPVQWLASMHYLLKAGVGHIREAGNGSVLSNLWRDISSEYDAMAQASALIADQGAVFSPAPAARALPSASAFVPASVPASASLPPTLPEPLRAFLPAAATVPASMPASATGNHPPSAVVRSFTPAPSHPLAKRSAASFSPLALQAEQLGSSTFRSEYGLRYAYLAGAMFRGIGSTAIVIRMAQAGMMGFFGAGGLAPAQVEKAILDIKSALPAGASWGMNLLHAPEDVGREQAAVDLYLKHDVRFVEAAGFLRISAPLLEFRFKGSRILADGRAVPLRHVMAKVSRPEVARQFLQPAPAALVDKLLAEGRLSPDEAALARRFPVCDSVCVEADSGGHTDAGNGNVLLPDIMMLRDAAVREFGYTQVIAVGAAGGIGTPQAAMVAFMLGADFILTGSINQCSPEANTSDRVKQMLSEVEVQDTAYAPAGDMFELGARVQVLKKGTLFSARGNKLHQLYKQYASLDEIDDKTRKSLETFYFKRSIDEVWQETCQYFAGIGKQAEIDKANQVPKHKMALVFRWYFAYSIRIAVAGDSSDSANYQVHCGPAQGAFNAAVRGTQLQDWRARHVDVMAHWLINETAHLLTRRFHDFANPLAA
jgi:trans-AT polyketide synthase/acyltransferase/oxidoreductase domain-containing protein